VKKWFWVLPVCLVVFPVLCPAAAGARPTQISITVDGAGLVLDVPPMVRDGRVLVPLRSVGGALQAQVAWDGAARAVRVTGRGVVISLRPGERKAEVNSLPVSLDVPAMLVQNRVLVPLGFIARTCGAAVVWDGPTRTVRIFTVPTGESVTGRVYGRVRVPFILPLPSAGGGGRSDETAEIAVAGRWDLNAGKVELEDTPLFNLRVERSADCRPVWDGGERICFLCAPGCDPAVGGVRPGYRAEVWRWTGTARPVVYCPSGDRTALAAWFARDEAGRGAGREHGVVVVEIRRAGREPQKLTVAPPTAVASGPYPLLVYGRPDDFGVLVDADFEALAGEGGWEGLLLAEVKGGDVRWRTIAGGHGGFIAGAGACVVKCGERIFIDDRVLDLSADTLKLEKYPPVDGLLDTVKDKFTFLPQPLRPVLYTYRDVLLVSATGADEMWLWAVQGDRCVGELYGDLKNRRLLVYHEGRLTDRRILPAGFSAFPVWPEYGGGSWK